MTRAAALAALCLLTLGCAALNHAPPRDASIEASGVSRGAESQPPAPAHLRVVTYNVHGISGNAIARALAGDPIIASADVVLLQEVASFGPCSAACGAAKALGMTALYAPGHSQDGGTSGVAILARYPLRDPQVIELPYQYAVVNSARRIALAATLDTARGPLRIVSVHLENRISPDARVRQLAPALAHLAAWQGPALIGGDMNTSPFSWVGHLIPIPTGRQDDALVAAARRAGLQTPLAQSRATSKWLGMRLDAIYTRGLVTPSGGVADGVRASDHLPLWLEAHLPADAAFADAAAPR